MPRIPAPVAGLMFAAALGGCAIQELRQEVVTRQHGVETKQRELDTLERTQAELSAERDRLLADLQGRELNAAQLKARLEQMRRINDAAPVRTPEERRQRETRARQLDEAARKAQALEHGAAPSQQEKQKRLQQLKDETSKMLRLLLVG